MSSEFLDGPRRRSTHRQVGTERLTQDVNPWRHVRPSGGPSDNHLKDLLRERLSRSVAEDAVPRRCRSFRHASVSRVVIGTYRMRPHSAWHGATPEQFANTLCGRSPAQTPGRADWKNKNKDAKKDEAKSEDLSLSV